LLSRRIWRFVSVLGFLVLLWAAFRPEPIPQYTQDFDKWTHLIAFGGLTFAVLLAFPRWSLMLVCAALILVGVGIEFGQEWFLPKRAFDWQDALADGVGVLIGAVFAVFARKQLS
jgi:VanZ family protein